MDSGLGALLRLRLTPISSFHESGPRGTRASFNVVSIIAVDSSSTLSDSLDFAAVDNHVVLLPPHILVLRPQVANPSTPHILPHMCD